MSYTSLELFWPQPEDMTPQVLPNEEAKKGKKTVITAQNRSQRAAGGTRNMRRCQKRQNPLTQTSRRGGRRSDLDTRHSGAPKGFFGPWRMVWWASQGLFRQKIPVGTLSASLGVEGAGKEDATTLNRPSKVGIGSL